MGRKRKKTVLDVYLGAGLVGRYTRAPDGATSFRYSDKWLADTDKSFPISMPMPLSDRIWSGDVINSYFDGLLPDDRIIKEQLAAREHADSASERSPRISHQFLKTGE